MFSSATDFVINMLKMNNLIIDAANDRIILQIILKDKSYTNEYLNNSENFDQLSSIIFQFLNKYNTKLDDISNIFVNKGPGKFSGIRASIVIAKALSLANNIDLYGFANEDVLSKKNYKNIVDSTKKDNLTKNLIIPQYSS